MPQAVSLSSSKKLRKSHSRQACPSQPPDCSLRTAAQIFRFRGFASAELSRLNSTLYLDVIRGKEAGGGEMLDLVDYSYQFSWIEYLN